MFYAPLICGGGKKWRRLSSPIFSYASDYVYAKNELLRSCFCKAPTRYWLIWTQWCYGSIVQVPFQYNVYHLTYRHIQSYCYGCIRTWGKSEIIKKSYFHSHITDRAQKSLHKNTVILIQIVAMTCILG